MRSSSPAIFFSIKLILAILGLVVSIALAAALLLSTCAGLESGVFTTDAARSTGEVIARTFGAAPFRGDAASIGGPT